MTNTADGADKKLPRHSGWPLSFRVASSLVLLLSLLVPKFAVAAILIDPGSVGESFFTRSYDVTSDLRNAGVRNANGRSVILDFIFGETKGLRVNGDGISITASLETDWVTNPSGIGRGYSLLFGSASSVSWSNDGSVLFVDSTPSADTSPAFSTPPSFFDVAGSVPTRSFPAYLVDVDGFSFSFRLPSSSNFGFPATVSEEQLVLSSAKLRLFSEGRPTGFPGIEAFSEYTVVSIPEPSTSVLTAVALLVMGSISRRRQPR